MTPLSIPKPKTCTPECWRDTNTLEIWHQKGCPTWPMGGFVVRPTPTVEWERRDA